MTQATSQIGSGDSGTAYRTADNAGKQAILNHHKGNSAPSYAEAGIIWLNDTATPWLLNFYDGTDWITLGEVNATNNTFQPYNGTATSRLLNHAADTGAANVYAVAPAPAITAYATGQIVTLKPANANTGASTINVGGLGAKNIKTLSGLDPVTGTLLTTGVYPLMYDGTNFVILNPTLNVQGANIASVATVNLTTATGDYVHITGTTTITAITLAQGLERTVTFDGILTLTNGASLILPGSANITTAVGDTAILRGEASGVVRCIAYNPANGKSVASSSGAGGYRVLSGTDTVVAGDNGKTLTISGACALALTAATTLGNFSCFIQNTATSGVAVITITPNGADNLDGANSTLTILPQEIRELNCNGTALTTDVVVPFYISGTSTATPSFPRTGYIGYNCQIWAGGGGSGTNNTNQGGGGGGSWNGKFITAANMGTSQTITIGAGGTGGTSSPTAGGNSSIGSLLLAYGGGFAVSGGTYGAGGGGGGPAAAGGNGTTAPVAGAGGGPDGGAAGSGTGGQRGYIGGGGGDINFAGGNAISCGGGGGAGTTGGVAHNGGNAYNGGGGGGTNAAGSLGGTSINGGNGGSAASPNGIVPGGGAGGGGNGAPGQFIIQGVI